MTQNTTDTSAPAPDSPDYKDTVFLPKTAFPMKAGLPQKEPQILERWQSENLEAQIRASRRGSKRGQFILHDGPPYANGDIHIGHALNHILKDMVIRTQTLKGKDAPYVPGWDCHGLPIEWKVEEQYRKKKRNKDEVPIAEFRAECRAYARHWVDVQRTQLKRLGLCGDWDNPYLTMDYAAEATIVAELLKFAESGQIYRGARPVMWSPVEKTALAEAEIEYQDITSTQIDVAFEIVSAPIAALVGARAVVWTTTPWTIPVNQAIAYSEDITYGLYESAEGSRLLIAVDTANMVRARGIDIGAAIVTFAGRELSQGEIIAQHPMHHLGGFFAKPRPFLAGDFVTTDSGTGLVHMAPDHGEDDFDLCQARGAKYSLAPQYAVEDDGRYRADWLWLPRGDARSGSVINAKFNAPDGPICSDLREVGALLAASADYQHSYPHSWRSKAKIVYRCTPQWFIALDKPIGKLPSTGKPATLPSQAPEQAPEQTSNQAPEQPTGAHTGETLRSLALAAIDDTRFVPSKGRNRLRAMVEGRPDWVLSRQRAWGVPITLFVERESGAYLCAPEVNKRIVAAIAKDGIDAWCDDRAQEYLGESYRAADYERVTDILDVWFDSGSTHAFVIESGRWPQLQQRGEDSSSDDSPSADLYLEGSDQHRGWFQSSLLQSCGTRGRAPYSALFTHGFTMDAKGLKMSKSLGNVISPLDLMRDYGADILRLWALSVDYSEDHRIGKEILGGVADQYRKLRNVFRYMLGALADFDKEREQVEVAEFPELERYMLSLLRRLNRDLKTAVDDFDFTNYVRRLSQFCNEDLSAFYFDIRKDCLYCDVGRAVPHGTDTRRAYRTMLDILFHALVRYAAPVLVFTSEEVWSTRYPQATSVHLLEWPTLPAVSDNPTDSEATIAKWDDIRKVRRLVTEAIEPYRRDKQIRSSLEADVELTIRDRAAFESCQADDIDMAEICITSSCVVQHGSADEVQVASTVHAKCPRCWRHLPEVTEQSPLCQRCDEVMNAR